MQSEFVVGGVGGWFFSDYRVSPNFLLCWGWVVVEVGLGCDNKYAYTVTRYYFRD